MKFMEIVNLFVFYGESKYHHQSHLSHISNFLDHPSHPYFSFSLSQLYHVLFRTDQRQDLRHLYAHPLFYGFRPRPHLI